MNHAAQGWADWGGPWPDEVDGGYCHRGKQLAESGAPAFQGPSADPGGGYLRRDYTDYNGGRAWLFDMGSVFRNWAGWNHWGQGYNVLFMDGHVWWLSDPDDSWFLGNQASGPQMDFIRAIDGH